MQIFSGWVEVLVGMEDRGSGTVCNGSRLLQGLTIPTR